MTLFLLGDWFMKNDLGFIDKVPFNKIDDTKQDMILLNLNEDYLEIKVTGGIDKYDSFDMFHSGPGKLVESKLYYGINSKYYPITFFNANIKNTTYSSISSSTIISNMYAIGREVLEPIKHITPETKIKKFNYYNDKLIYYFSDNPISIKRKGIQEEITLNAKTTKPKLLFSLKYNEVNEVKVYLIHSFRQNGNVYDFSIKANTYLQIIFKRSANIDDVLRISSRIDSTLHMCMLNKNRNYMLTLYDYTKRSYNFYNFKLKKYVSDKIPTFSICKDKSNATEIFKNLLALFINIDFENSNTYLPFINFNKETNYYEMEFLQYYKVLEVIDFEKQKSRNKGKDTCFLKKYLKKYEKLKKYFFKDTDIETLEKEVRSLRNYYSHDGFYVENLPVPTDNPIYFKKIDVQWIYDVKRLVKIIAYNEIYDKANVIIDELELTNYLY